MYIAKKERKNKHDEQVYYFYLAESKRVEGKVKNVQKYMISFKVSELDNVDAIETKIKKLDDKFSDSEIDILKNKLDELFNTK